MLVIRTGQGSPPWDLSCHVGPHPQAYLPMAFSPAGQLNVFTWTMLLRVEALRPLKV